MRTTLDCFDSYLDVITGLSIVVMIIILLSAVNLPSVIALCLQLGQCASLRYIVISKAENTGCKSSNFFLFGVSIILKEHVSFVKWMT